MNEENGINYYAIIPATVRLVSIETVSRWLAHLQQLGYIEIIIQRDDNKKIIARHIYIIDKPYSEDNQYPIDEKINTPTDKKINTPIDEKVNTLLTEKSIPPIDKKVNTLLTKKSIPIDEKVKENNINNNNTSNNKIDDIFYYIINKSTKISKDFHNIIERLEFNYTEKMLFMLNEENLQMLKNIIYVLYELHNSKFDFLLSKVSRESLFNLYRTSQEHNPKDLLSYYKKAIINKYNDSS